jgi:hypothetical protein
MLLLLNNAIVIIIKVDFKALLKVLKGLKSLLLLLLLPNLLPNKLGITKEIFNRTIVVPKNPGNNNNNSGFSPLKPL